MKEAIEWEIKIERPKMKRVIEWKSGREMREWKELRLIGCKKK